MIYPRLKLAKNLLREDGVLAVSIDDDEMPRLRLILDEIFGEDNFYANICWQKKYAPANDAKRFSDMHDFIVLVSRTNKFVRGLLPRTDENNKPYKYDDGDGRGWYRTDNLSVRTYSASNDFPVVNPVTGAEYLPPAGGCWRFSREKFAELQSDNRIFWGNDGRGAPQLKRYLSEVQQGTVPTTWWGYEFAGHNDESRKELKALFETTALFDTPKPTKLLRRLLQVLTTGSSEDIVLDFFAGSGTLGDAVLRQNLADGGSRPFIVVQLPEPLPEKAKGIGWSPETIADVTRERIRRAGKKILEGQAGELEGRAEPLDVGFRSYRLVGTNFATWNQTSDTTVESLEQVLAAQADSSAANAASEWKLTELLLKLGFSLTEKIERISISGLEVFRVADGLALAFADEHILPTLEQLRALVAEHPEKLIIVEDAFHGFDELKTNLAQECRAHHVDLYTA